MRSLVHNLPIMLRPAERVASSCLFNHLSALRFNTSSGEERFDQAFPASPSHVNQSPHIRLPFAYKHVREARLSVKGRALFRFMRASSSQSPYSNRAIRAEPSELSSASKKLHCND